MKNVYLLLIIGVFTCCESKVKSIGDTKLSDSITLYAKTLNLEQIPLQDSFLCAKDYLVYHDSMLIVCNGSKAPDYFIEVSNLNTGAKIRDMVHKGNGPKEALFIDAKIDKNILIVNDFAKNQVAFINLDSICIKDYDYNFIDIGTTILSINKGADNDIIIENPNCFKDEKLNIDNETPRLCLFHKGDKVTFKEAPYYSRNVTGGHLLVNLSEDKVVYASLYNAVLEFYDGNLQLLKRLTGPAISDIQYYVEGNELMFNHQIPYGYLNVCSSDRYVYFIYIGQPVAIGDNLYRKDSWIFKFDWSGNFVDSRHSEQCLSSLSITSNEDEFFATSHDENNMPILVKFKM